MLLQDCIILDVHGFLPLLHAALIVSSLLHLLGPLLDLSHRQSFFYRLIIQFQLQLGIIERQQGTGVAHVQGVVMQTQLYLGGQLQQPQEIGNGSALLADALAEPFLCELVLVDEFAEGECNLNGVQVLALDILDQRHLSHLAVVGRADIGRHRLQSRQQSCAVTSLTRNDLVSIFTDAA